jgi:hypothetical protein
LPTSRKKPYTAAIENGPGPNEFVVRAKILQPPDHMFAILAGEIAHHLRSALDYAIGELITVHTGRPPKSDYQFEFPIFDDARKFRKTKERKRDGIPSGAETFLEAAQPYHILNRGGYSSLWYLHRINIEDKHRALHLMGGGAAVPIISHSGAGGADVLYPAKMGWSDHAF